MSVRIPVQIDRPCGKCGESFTPAVLTPPDPARDMCPDCADAFIRGMMCTDAQKR